MTPRFATLSVFALTLALVAFGLFLVPSSAVDAQASAAVRVVHIALGPAAVDVTIDGQRVFSGLAFKAATDYAPLPAANHTIRVTPTGQPQQVLVDAQFAPQPGQQVTVALLGEAPSVAALVLTDDNSAPPPGQARVRFVHGAPDVPPADMLVRGGRELFDGVAFGTVGQYVTVPAGTYTLDVRPDGQTTVALSVPNVTLAAGQVLTIFATGKVSDNTLSAVPILYRPSILDEGRVGVVRSGTGAPMDHTLDATGLALVAALLAGAGVTLWLATRRSVGRRTAGPPPS